MPDILKGTSLNAEKTMTDPTAGQEALCSREGASISTNQAESGAAICRLSATTCNLESCACDVLARHPGS